MKKYALPISTMLGLLTLSSCAMPGVVSNPNCGFPQSVTETHTKTTLVAPPSYNMPYLPPSAIYQSAPVAAPQPMQAPACPQPMYQASPVCAPAPMYQANPCQPVQLQSYQDPCAPVQYNQPHPQQMYAPQNVRYNVVGTAQPAQPQYIVVQPTPASNSMPVQLNNTRTAAEHCE